MKEVVIVAAQRTPIGRFLGSLANYAAVDLGVGAAQSALAKVPNASIDQVIVGNVLSAGLGMNVARQIGIKLGLPVSVPAYTVNMMCGSGMHAVALAAQAIRGGDARAILCGGTESMTNAPHVLPRERSKGSFGNRKLRDTILCDGLTDAINHEHMAATAERLANKYAITRSEQDAFALMSQHRYGEAQQHNAFDAELVSVGDVAADEHPRPSTTAEQLAELKAAFDPQGTITAGNSSGINDGAAMLVVAERTLAEDQGWPMLAVIGGMSAIGCDPKEMGLGPVYSIKQILEQGGDSLEDYDGIEINEAFAAQVLACLRELELSADRINVHGGAIALGHPIATSGARLVTHLGHQIHAGKVQRGLATACVGGGMGIAVALGQP